MRLSNICGQLRGQQTRYQLSAVIKPSGYQQPSCLVSVQYTLYRPGLYPTEVTPTMASSHRLVLTNLNSIVVQYNTVQHCVSHSNLLQYSSIVHCTVQYNTITIQLQYNYNTTRQSKLSGAARHIEIAVGSWQLTAEITAACSIDIIYLTANASFADHSIYSRYLTANASFADRSNFQHLSNIGHQTADIWQLMPCLLTTWFTADI
jgi:hypothetical protein